MSRKKFLGIDPGKSGGIACLTVENEVVVNVGLFSMADKTDHQIADWLEDMMGPATFAVFENVHSSPQMGVASSFTFGNYSGFVRGVLAALNVPYAKVTPQKWQKALNCLSKGNKNITKAAAHRLYPAEASRITHAVADALLLATYCKRFYKELF